MKGLPKIDFKAVLMSTAGEAGGLFALNMLAKQDFVAKQKPVFKGLIYKLAGAALKHVAGKKGKGSELIDGAASALSVAGTSNLMAGVMPGKVPTIGNYEDNPIAGPGYQFVEGADDEDDPNGVGAVIME